ncbi:hypothetical protein EHS25_001624 [Saitozyma podzolica]|uniref:Syntaxin 6/10/61 N-terminal domain-containing protein n=1 Tax=Saitozyma podzolica TaxID=1890683 RepID=A0A427YGT7_9TREE|nr:hypothetical protein EHS25_001624 [Saitozyma podzolica]
MSRDPYIDVKREVEQTLSATHNLLASYERIASTSSSTSSAVSEARDELRGTLALLEADLEDLDESVRVVESTGDRWGIAPDEVSRRRGFVERVKKEVRGLRGKVFGKGGASPKGKERAMERYADDPDAMERGEAEDLEEAKRWEMEEQQMIVKKQDDTLGVISGTLHTLASQAGLIGHEVVDQTGWVARAHFFSFLNLPGFLSFLSFLNFLSLPDSTLPSSARTSSSLGVTGMRTKMLEDLTGRVDDTDSRLRKVQRTMNDFIRRNEETKSGWCICILIFVLIALLIAVIIT